MVLIQKIWYIFFYFSTNLRQFCYQKNKAYISNCKVFIVLTITLGIFFMKCVLVIIMSDVELDPISLKLENDQS